MMNNLTWFRQSAPYIQSHRDKVFVIAFSGEVIEHENFKQFIHDISLLKILGIKLVLVHGAQPQIQENLKQQGIQTPVIEGLRVTTREALPAVLNAVGTTRLTVEAQLTFGLTYTDGIRPNVVSGNYVMARPYGIQNGVDFQLTGKVRSIDAQAIVSNLENQQIVLIGSTGYSNTGEVFHLRTEDVAVKTAAALKAHKLIFMEEYASYKDTLQTDYTSNQLTNSIQDLGLPQGLHNKLLGSAKACDNGVQRAHIVSYKDKNALLTELFSRDGSGVMVSANPFEEIQEASINDVGGLLNLLAPLEEKGILIQRSKEKLEREIPYFVVSKRDNIVIACAALYPVIDDIKTHMRYAEIGCVAVHHNYRSQKRGEKVLKFLENKAKEQGVEKIFVLTTQTAHWFVEQGFSLVSVEDLPKQKQETYNHKRQSHVYMKSCD